jgi:hypothetical protein
MLDGVTEASSQIPKNLRLVPVVSDPIRQLNDTLACIRLERFRGIVLGMQHQVRDACRTWASGVCARRKRNLNVVLP